MNAIMEKKVKEISVINGAKDTVSLKTLKNIKL